MIILSLANDIKTKRKAEKLTAEGLAERIGVSKDNIYKWEKGTKPSDPEDYQKIMAWLGRKIEIVPIKKPGSFDYQADLKDAMATIRSYNDFLQRMLESSLGKVLRDQEGNSGIIVELLKRDVRREADGNPEKEKEILDEIVHRIGPKLGSDLKEGISADGGR